MKHWSAELSTDFSSKSSRIAFTTIRKSKFKEMRVIGNWLLIFHNVSFRIAFSTIKNYWFSTSIHQYRIHYGLDNWIEWNANHWRLIADIFHLNPSRLPLLRIKKLNQRKHHSVEINYRDSTLILHDSIHFGSNWEINENTDQWKIATDFSGKSFGVGFTTDWTTKSNKTRISQ